jgi:hypothetical protein
LLIDHRGTRGGGESGLGLAQGIVLHLALGSYSEPFGGRRAQAFDGVVDAFDGFTECGDDGLVGSELDDLAELRAGSPSFSWRVRSAPLRCPRASSASPWLATLALCAANCRLAARRAMRVPFGYSGGLRPLSFRGDAKHRTRNLEIPGLVPTHHPGMTAMHRLPGVLPKSQLFSAGAAPIVRLSR